MKAIALLLVLAAVGTQAASPSSRDPRVVELLTNYVRDFGEAEFATLVVDWRLDDAGFRCAYWIEAKSLLRFPDDFTDDALTSPVLVTKARNYPADVRPRGHPDLATSMYLEEERSFRRRVFRIVTGGEVLRVRRPNQSPRRNAGSGRIAPQ